MNKLVLVLAVGLAALAIPQPAAAGVQLRINLGLPQVLPPLVEVQPGYRVLQDFDQEIIFVNGRYWTVRDGNWYRARDPRRTWYYVRSDRVPQSLRYHRPGTWRNYKGHQGNNGRHEGWQKNNAKQFGKSSRGYGHSYNYGRGHR